MLASPHPIKGRAGFRRWLVQPRYILPAAVLLGVFVYGTSLYEQRRDRQTILDVMRYQAESLAQVVAQSAELAVYSNEETEAEVVNRLAMAARMVQEMDRRRRLTRDELADLATRLALHQIRIYGTDGRARRGTDDTGQRLPGWAQPVLGHPGQILVGGTGTGASSGGAVALGLPGGAIVVHEEPDRHSALRRQVGIGRLIQEFGTKSGVAYVMLQDREGILAASKRVTSAPSIASDPFLAGVEHGGQSNARLTAFEGRQVFETVAPFVLDGEAYGLLRIALWPTPLEESEARARIRLIWMSAGLLIVGMALLNFLLLKQDYDTVDRAFRQIRTYTGDVLDNMADGVVVVDKEGRISTFNPAAETIFGFTAGEVLGRSCRDVVTADTPVLDRTLRDGAAIQDVECRYTTRKGRDLVLSVNTSVLRNEAGEVEASIAVVRDLTQQKRQEAEARRRERLVSMGELASAVAHEIRNPLNAAGMVVQRFGSEFTPVEDQEEYLKLAGALQSEIDRASRIVEQFLDLARPARVRRAAVDLDAVVRELLTVVSGKARQQGVSMAAELNLEDPILVDREQLAQAILNLVMNAVQAMSNGGLLTVRTQLLDDWTPNLGPGPGVTIEVEDTGVGMDEETAARAFDPYFTTKPEGTGLGLSQVERVVSDHGGTVKVETRKGKGTLIRIVLPKVTDGD